MDEIGWLDDKTKEALTNIGVEAFDDFRTTDFGEISSEDVINGEFETRLRALFWLSPQDGVAFTDPDKIRTRRDHAQLGFDTV